MPLSRRPAPAGTLPWTERELDDLRERYDTAVRSGIIHNRLRAWDSGNHPGYVLGTWRRDYKEQVFLFTRNSAVSWTNNVSERGAKAAKRHQVVSGYWHSLAPLGRWCRSAATLTLPPPTASAHSTPSATPALGKPWLPPLPHSPSPAHGESPANDGTARGHRSLQLPSAAPADAGRVLT